MISFLPEVPAKDGYRGVWTIDGMEVTAESVYSFNADKTAVAVYTLVHTVTFDGENAIVVDDGAKLERPADPSKEATVSAVYTFDAWDFEVDVVTEDINLVAEFIESVRTYTVSYNVSGREDVVLEDKTAEYGATVDLTTLLDGVDLEGYTVAITVDGKEATSIEVVGDVVVNVEFTADKVEESTEESAVESTEESTVESTEESAVESTESVKESVEEPAKKGGCGGSAVGTTMFSVLSLLAVAMLRRKSNK